MSHSYGYSMIIQHFYDLATSTLSYVVHDETTRDAVIIDPVLDFDDVTGAVSEGSAQALIAYAKELNLTVRAILETHVHADHLSAAQVLKRSFPGSVVGIGAGIRIVQDVFKQQFELPYLQTDGSQFDRLFSDNEEVAFGSLRFKAIPTPGHTPACMSYLFGDALFVGDALFMPDSGTGRCDFPKGSAESLYRSVAQTLFSLPDETRVFVGHDYSPGGREMRFQTSIGESKQSNIQLTAATSLKDYIDFRTTRDKTLKAPRLLEPSIRVNISAGHLTDLPSRGK